MSNVIVIDGSYLLYKTFHSTRSMFNADGIDVSVAYRVLNNVITYILRYEPSNVHFVLDVGRDLKKKNKYKKYKANRETRATAENIYKHNLSKEQHDRLELSRNILLSILATTPIKVYTIPYIEGDTLCGAVAIEEAKAGNTVNILTGDKDYLQLVDENISVTFLSHGKLRPVEETYTLDDAYNIWLTAGLTIYGDKIPKPKLIPYFRSLVGDKSDNLGGVSGIGDKFASKMLNVAIDNNVDNFEGFDDCVSFYKRVVDEVREKITKKTDKTRKVAEKISKIITDAEKLEQWKITWELSDIEYSYDNLPAYGLDSFFNIYRKEKEYEVKEFLSEIIKYEFDSIDDYKKWVAILECLCDNNWNNLKIRAGVGWYKMINSFNIVSDKVSRYYNKLERDGE